MCCDWTTCCVLVAAVAAALSTGVSLCAARARCSDLDHSARCHGIESTFLPGSCPYARLVLPSSSATSSSNETGGPAMWTGAGAEDGQLPPVPRAALLAPTAASALAAVSSAGCHPSLRAVSDPTTGAAFCHHDRPYPSSFDVAAAAPPEWKWATDDGAAALSQLAVHMPARSAELPTNWSLSATACGAWIDGVNDLGSLAFHDSWRVRAAATELAHRLVGEPQLASTSVGRFAAACSLRTTAPQPELTYTLERAVAFGVLQDAMERAADALQLHHDAGRSDDGSGGSGAHRQLPLNTDRARGMAAHGVLLAYNCPTDVLVDLQPLCGDDATLDESLVRPTDDELRRHVRALEPFSDVRHGDELGREEEAGAGAGAADDSAMHPAATVSNSDVHAIFIGMRSAGVSVPAALRLQLGRVEMPFPTAGRLRGLAALCTDVERAAAHEPPLSCGPQRTAAEKYSADGAPRHIHLPSGTREDDAGPSPLEAATSAAGSSAGTSTCASAALRAFPDAAAQLYFDVLAGDELYRRAERVFASARAAIRRAVLVDELGAFDGPVERLAAAAAVDSVHIRILGAPSGTWANPLSATGASANLVSQSTHATGSVLLMLEERRRRKLERLLSSGGGAPAPSTDPCAHPPLMQAVDANAYFSGRLRCVLVAPGLLRRPLADAAYDDESLLAGVGFFVAHELAHAVDHLFGDRFRERVAAAYGHSRFVSEGAADLLAVHAMSAAGERALAEHMLRFAQVFCTTAAAREGARGPRRSMPLAALVPPSSRPPAAARAQATCTPSATRASAAPRASSAGSDRTRRPPNKRAAVCACAESRRRVEDELGLDLCRCSQAFEVVGH